MKAVFAISTLLLTSALPATANVDPETHKLCSDAKDYVGCVNAQKGNSNSSTVTNINIDGGVKVSGNSCPKSYVYTGAGYCEKIICVYRGLYGKGHGQDLGGKGASCS